MKPPAVRCSTSSRGLPLWTNSGSHRDLIGWVYVAKGMERLMVVPSGQGPDLHRDKLGLADDADRQALRELRVVAPIALAMAIVIWFVGAGPFALLPALMIVLAFVQWRAAFLRRRARRSYHGTD